MFPIQFGEKQRGSKQLAVCTEVLGKRLHHRLHILVPIASYSQLHVLQLEGYSWVCWYHVYLIVAGASEQKG